MAKNIDLGISKLDNIDLSELVKQGGEPEEINISLSDGDGLFFSTTKVEQDGMIAGVEVKKGDELHFVLGAVLEPESVDLTRTPQSKGDIYSADEVRKSAHDFMVNYSGGGHDVQHNRQESQMLKVVESFIAPVEMVLKGRVIKAGTWMMGSLIFDPSIWKRIKSGQLTGYSIEGLSNARLETP